MLPNLIMTEIWDHPAWPNFDYDALALESSLADWAQALGQVQGRISALAHDDQTEIETMIRTREALASFGIEGVTLNPKEMQASIAASLAMRTSSSPERRSDAIAELMKHARQDHPLDEAVLFKWHNLLFQGIELEDKGRWRRFEIEIAKSAVAGRTEVLFRPIPAKDIADNMTIWLQSLKNKKRPAIIHAGIMHLWFESIHPFSDGNGRIGRAIIDHIFARAGGPLPFSLSQQIEKDKQSYYDALQAARLPRGDVIDATPFLAWLLETGQRAAAVANGQIGFLLSRNHFFNQHQLSPRADTVFRKLFAQGPERVELGITPRSYVKIAKCSPATATRDLLKMVQLGVLRKGEDKGRSQNYLINL